MSTSLSFPQRVEFLDETDTQFQQILKNISASNLTLRKFDLVSHFAFPSTLMKTLLNALSQCKNIEEMKFCTSIDNWNDISRDFDEFFKETKLKTFNLMYFKTIHLEIMDDILKILKSSESLETLMIEFAGTTSFGYLASLQQTIHKFPYESLGDFVASSKSLHSLHVNDLSDALVEPNNENSDNVLDSVIHFLSSLTKISTLRKFGLSHIVMNGKIFEFLIECINRSTITNLMYFQSFHGEQTFLGLEIFRKCKKLQNLELKFQAGSQIFSSSMSSTNDHFACQLFNSLLNIESSTRLSLVIPNRRFSSSKVYDTLFEYLVSDRSKNLVGFGMKMMNSLLDVTKFIESIAKCTNLEKLWLGDLELKTSQNSRDFDLALRKMVNLQDLKVSGALDLSSGFENFDFLKVNQRLESFEVQIYSDFNPYVRKDMHNLKPCRELISILEGIRDNTTLCSFKVINDGIFNEASKNLIKEINFHVEMNRKLGSKKGYRLTPNTDVNFMFFKEI